MDLADWSKQVFPALSFSLRLIESAQCTEADRVALERDQPLEISEELVQRLEVSKFLYSVYLEGFDTVEPGEIVSELVHLSKDLGEVRNAFYLNLQS